MLVNVELEDWSGSPVVRLRGRDYERKAAVDFHDDPARITERQAVFYRNLIRIAVAISSRQIPVDFELPDGRAVYLDRGCIKIAEHAGFIDELLDGPSGVLESIQLSWRC